MSAALWLLLGGLTPSFAQGEATPTPAAPSPVATIEPSASATPVPSGTPTRTVPAATATKPKSTPSPTLAPTKPLPTPTATKPGSIKWAFYVVYNVNSWVSLQANVKSLTHVSPYYFYAGKDGQISGSDQAQASSLLRQNKVKIVPMVKNTIEYNDWTAVMSDTEKLDSMVDQLDRLVDRHNYDGITIDFEGLNATDRPYLTDFMRRLYERFRPKGKLVVMAVAVKVRDTTTGWSGPYDYAALAPHLDYMLIMAYDWSWSTSNPGAIAPMDKVRAGANYTLTKVPAHKILWGVGVYGYDWQVKEGTREADGKAEYRTFAEANVLSVAPGAESGYDKEAEAPYVRYRRDDKPREMWYEDRRSFEAKLSLVEEKKFAGFGIWRLGQEDPLIWKSLANQRVSVACAPVKAFKSTDAKVYFKESGHSLGGVFLKFWRENGGLPVYGYPLTEEFMETSPTDGKPYRVQYFERNRFEHHPEKKPPHDVELGLLGVETTQGRHFPGPGFEVPGPDWILFPQVKHSLSGKFLSHWQSKGGLSRFGYPISEPMLERSKLDDKVYLVQYLERARMELHPEYAGTESEVLLGHLGRDVLPCVR
jgi:spore germination protein